MSTLTLTYTSISSNTVVSTQQKRKAPPERLTKDIEVFAKMCIIHYTVHNPCHCIHIHRDPTYCDGFLARYLETQEAANAAAATTKEDLKKKLDEAAAVSAAAAAEEKSVGEGNKTDEEIEGQGSTDTHMSDSLASEESVAFPPTFEAKVITFHPHLHGLRLRWEGYLFQSHNLDMVVRPDGFECPDMVTRFEDVAWAPSIEVKDNSTNDARSASSDYDESRHSAESGSESAAGSSIDDGSDDSVATHTAPHVPRSADKLHCPLCIIRDDIVRIMVEAATGVEESAARLAELREKERKHEAFVKRRSMIQKIINEGQQQVVRQMRQQQKEAKKAAERAQENQHWLAHQATIRESIRNGALLEIAIPCQPRDWNEVSPYANSEEALREKIRTSYGDHGILRSYERVGGQRVLLVIPEAWAAATPSGPIKYLEEEKTEGSQDSVAPTNAAAPTQTAAPENKVEPYDFVAPWDLAAPQNSTWYKGPTQIHEARFKAGVAMMEASAAAQGSRQLQTEQDHWDKVQAYCDEYCDLCKKRKIWGI